MKKLSIEEKAKAYDEAIKVAKSNYETIVQMDNDCTFAKEGIVNTFHHMFPELKESDDEKNERIRLGILEVLKTVPSGLFKERGNITLDEAFYWLECKEYEKQGEQKQPKELTNSEFVEKCKGLSRLEQHILALVPTRPIDAIKVDARTVRYLVEQEQGEQTPADKVEPKFKIGDFIVNDYCMGKVVEITNDAYLLDTEQGIPFSCHSTHLWDITKDAKDGDVLVASDDSIFLFKGTIDGACKHYVALTTDGVVKFNEGLEHYWENSTAVHPATKEQRDILMKAMHKAGYEWDAEKKELKKVEQKPAWNEEDEMIKESIITGLEMLKDGASDESLIALYNKKIDWLKSLRPQNRWKPSDEQIRILELAIDYWKPNDVSVTTPLYNLLEQLKKLREE